MPAKFALTDPASGPQQFADRLEIVDAIAHRLHRLQDRHAEQSLADYYESKFHRSATDAKILAAFALDVALRSHYMFQSTDSQSHLRGENPEPNPWHVK